MPFFRTAKFRIKQAISSREELAKFNERTAQKVVTEIDPDHLYVVVSGLHGDEPNDNGDYFGWENELLRKLPVPITIAGTDRKAEYVFHTWIGKPNLVNHDANSAVGEIPDVWPLQAEKSIDMLIKVARKHTELVKGIESGQIVDVSMGCIVGHSYCSVCENLAHDEEEWCAHLHPGKLNLKGRKYNGEDGRIYASKVGQVCHEDNRDITGIEVSWITFGEGADSKAERKEILANKGGDAVARKRNASTAQISFNPERITDIRDGSVRRVTASAAESATAAAASSSPAPDALNHSLRQYIAKYGRPDEKKAIGLVGTAEEYNTAREVVMAINEQKLKKTAAIEACVKFGLAADPDELTPNLAMNMLATAADVDLVHEQIIQDEIDGKLGVDAQATGGDQPNVVNQDTADLAVETVEHEEGQPEQERKPTEPIEEQTTDSDYKITEPEGGDAGTDIPITQAKRRSKAQATGTSAAPNADQEPGTGEMALDKTTDAPPEEFPDGNERSVNEPVEEQTTDGEYTVTDSDTGTGHMEGELPYVAANKERHGRLIKSVQRYTKVLRASEKAKLHRIAKADGAANPADHVRTILADIKQSCPTLKDMRDNWPEIYAFLVEATGGDQGALNEEADTADLAIDEKPEEEMPKAGEARSPNAPQDEATSDADYKAVDEATDLPVSKAKKPAKADKVEEGMDMPHEEMGDMPRTYKEDHYKHKDKMKHKMKPKKGPRVVYGPEEKEGQGMAPPAGAPTVAPAAGGGGTYSARFSRAEKPQESAWIVQHKGADILKIQADKAIEDLKDYSFIVEDGDGTKQELKGLAAFGSLHYKRALLDGFNRLGAAKLVEQEFGGVKGGFVEVLAQALPIDVGVPAPEGLAEAPLIEEEGAPPANLDEDMTKELMEDEEEQSPLVDTIAEVLAQMIADNDERSVDEAFDELQSTFSDEDKASEFHGMLEEKVKSKEEEEAPEMELGDEERGEREERNEEVIALRAYKAKVEKSWPVLQSRLSKTADENAQLHAQLRQSHTKDRVMARATRAAQAVEQLVEVGFIESADSDEARQKVQELATMDSEDFERELAHVAELTKKLPQITAAKKPDREVPRVVTASIPNPAQSAVGIGLTGDGTDQGSRKSYADLWSRPPEISNL